MSFYRGSIILAVFLARTSEIALKQPHTNKKKNCFVSSHFSVVFLQLVNVKFNEPLLIQILFLFWLKRLQKKKNFLAYVHNIEMKELIYISTALDPAKKAVHQCQFSIRNG
ncbi:hypothetical protein ACKWTF_003164 [Chironomus riparius]